MQTKNHNGIWCQKSMVRAKLFIGFILVLGSACSSQNRNGTDSTTKETAVPQDKKLEDKLREGHKNASSTNTQTSSKPTKDEIVAFAQEKGILSGRFNVTDVAIKDLGDYKGKEQSCVYFTKGSSYVCADNGDLFVDATLAISEWGPHIRNVLPNPPPLPHVRNVLPSDVFGSFNTDHLLADLANSVSGQLAGQAENEGWTKNSCRTVGAGTITAIATPLYGTICATVGLSTGGAGVPPCLAWIAGTSATVVELVCTQLCQDKHLQDCK